MSVYGVITGDLVSSREISAESRKQLYDDVKKFVKQLKTEKWITKYDLSRGDTLQCLVKDVTSILRVALMIKSYIKSYVTSEQVEKYGRSQSKGGITAKGYFPGKQDIRLAMGIGDVDFISSDLGQSDGEAFYLSSEGLEELDNSSNRIILKTRNDEFNIQSEACFMLLDAVIDKWTNNQAEFVMYACQGKSDEEIKTMLGVSQPAVSQRKKTSQWYAIEKYIKYFELDVKKRYR